HSEPISGAIRRRTSTNPAPAAPSARSSRRANAWSMNSGMPHHRIEPGAPMPLRAAERLVASLAVLAGLAGVGVERVRVPLERYAAREQAPHGEVEIASLRIARRHLAQREQVIGIDDRAQIDAIGVEGQPVLRQGARYERDPRDRAEVRHAASR